jgi:hypothetical protein
MIGLPFSKKYRKEMGFPKEGEVVVRFKVESVSIEHHAAYTDKLARYEYPTQLIVEGEGTVDDVKEAFQKYFEVEKTIMSSYGNPYQCEPGKMYVQSLDRNRFKIEARGSCVRVLEEKTQTEKSIDLGEAALRAFDAIFDDHESVDIDEEKYLIERTPRANLRFVKIDKYTFLEQNPSKSSRWAKMAREGHRILWILVGRRYLGQVRDGMFYDFRKS